MRYEFIVYSCGYVIGHDHSIITSKVLQYSKGERRFAFEREVSNNINSQDK